MTCSHQYDDTIPCSQCAEQRGEIVVKRSRARRDHTLERDARIARHWRTGRRSYPQHKLEQIRADFIAAIGRTA